MTFVETAIASLILIFACAQFFSIINGMFTDYGYENNVTFFDKCKVIVSFGKKEPKYLYLSIIGALCVAFGIIYDYQKEMASYDSAVSVAMIWLLVGVEFFWAYTALNLLRTDFANYPTFKEHVSYHHPELDDINEYYKSVSELKANQGQFDEALRAYEKLEKIPSKIKDVVNEEYHLPNKAIDDVLNAAVESEVVTAYPNYHLKKQEMLNKNIDSVCQFNLNCDCSISKAGETARVEIKLGDKWRSMMIPCAAFEPNHLTNMDMSWKGKLWCDFGKTKLIKDGKLQRDNLARLKIEIEYPNEKYLSELEMFHKKYGDTIKQAEELEKKLRG